MAIAFVNAADLGNTTSTSYTAAYTCGSGANRLLMVGFLGDNNGGNDDITGVTYAGVSMTLAVKSTSTHNRFLYLYFLLGPATGANNVVISCTNSHFLAAVAADYTGVAQSGQPDATTTQESVNAFDTSLTTPISTVADNSWVILLEESYEAGPCATAGTGVTERICGVANGEPTLFDSNGVVHPAGSYSMTTNSPSNAGFYILHVVASFAPAGSGVAFSFWNEPLRPESVMNSVIPLLG